MGLVETGSPVTAALLWQPPVDDYMAMVKRSPSPPEACRSQLLPDWWVQQPSAGEGGSPALWGGCALTVLGLHALLLGVGGRAAGQP